jgi:hypothetical protein
MKPQNGTDVDKKERNMRSKTRMQFITRMLEQNKEINRVL